VKRGGGSAAPFLGEEGTPGWCACALERRRRLRHRLPGEEEAGRGPHGSERGGWRWAGPAGGQGPVGREAGLAWEKEVAQERRRGSGPVAGLTGRAEKEGGRAEIVARAEIYVSKRKSNFN
jgi:hypothetical protein